MPPASFSKRRAFEREPSVILAASSWCDPQAEIGWARDQLLVLFEHPGPAAVTNNTCERALRPTVVLRKVTNGYRAMWAAAGEADVRTGVNTARLPGAGTFATILNTFRICVRCRGRGKLPAGTADVVVDIDEKLIFRRVRSYDRS